MPEAHDDEFSLAIGRFTEQDDLEINIERLAKEFDVPLPLVRRWSEGTARPHPRIQKQVLTWIKKETR